MSFEVDYILDRRRLKRRLAFWRAFAVLGVIVAVGLAVWDQEVIGDHDYIAKITIDGVIVDDAHRNEALLDIADDEAARALIVNINSPGGTVVGGESLFRSLRAVAEKKPVVALMGELATSAGYMVAIGADYLIAREGTITGSIGVIMQTADITGLLEKLGIKSEVVKSSPLKAQPNPLEPFSPAARAAMQKVIADLHGMFIDLVAERRELDGKVALSLADGRIFTGRQAKKIGLIDALGGIKEARQWLQSEHDLPSSLPGETIKYGEPDDLIDTVFDSITGKMLLSERLRLDGLVSLWHPRAR